MFENNVTVTDFQQQKINKHNKIAKTQEYSSKNILWIIFAEIFSEYFSKNMREKWKRECPAIDNKE